MTNSLFVVTDPGARIIFDGADLPPALDLSIPGEPRAQGNPQRFPNGGMSYPKATIAQRSLVTSYIATAWQGMPTVLGPVAVTAVFQFPRPAAHYLPANRRRAVPELREEAPRHHMQKPDLDKLCRLIFDSTTDARFWGGDHQVAVLDARKVWVPFDQAGGTLLTLTPIT